MSAEYPIDLPGYRIGGEVRRTELCPKCDGQGLVAKPPWVAGDIPTWTSHTTAPYTCGLCNGAKVIHT